MAHFLHKIAENTLISVVAAFISGILVSALSALISESILPLWSVYPQHIREQNIFWMWTGVVAAVFTSMKYMLIRDLNSWHTYLNWFILLISLSLYSLFRDDLNFFHSIKYEYALFCFIITYSLILITRSIIYILFQIRPGMKNKCTQEQVINPD